MKLPSDRQILECIFDQYKGAFAKFDLQKDRATKVYVPIDCKAIAKKLGTEPDIVFGRLYYHLEKKYGFKQSDGVNVHLFALKIGPDSKCVNFPLLASVLAGMQEERRRNLLTQAIAIAAIAVSLVSLLVSLWTR
jgi:hypothetical protein